MEEGSLRCDANIFVTSQRRNKTRHETELKNMNTFRGVEKALEYEALRQKDALLSGEKIVQQTYLWDPNKNRTVAMRSKEDAHDYRYFPEPDLLPLVVESDWIETIKKDMPELPAQKRERFISKYGITPYMAEVVTSSLATSNYVEATLDNFHPESSKDNLFAANWIMVESLRVVKEKKIDINQLKVTPQRLAKLLDLVRNNALSANAAKKVFDLMESTDKDPEIIVEEQGLRQISDTGELEKIVSDILAKHAKEAARFKAGETKLMGFFVGEVMKATKGKGNPKEINKLVSELINRG